MKVIKTTLSVLCSSCVVVVVVVVVVTQAHSYC